LVASFDQSPLQGNNMEEITAYEILEKLNMDLERENKALREDIKVKSISLRVAMKLIEELKEENERLREALEFYADMDNYGYDGSCTVCNGYILPDTDKIAKAALSTSTS